MACSRLWSLLVCLLACSTVADRGTVSDDEAGEPDAPLFGQEPAQLEPNGVTFTALGFEQPYERIAVGNIARGVDEPDCCLDYVLGGPDANDVRVVFGGGASDGLTFLADRPDEVLPLGPMDDVLLVDLDEDGRNDLVGLRPEAEHEVVVRLGVADPPAEGPFLAGEGVGTSTLVVAQGQ